MTRRALAVALAAALSLALPGVAAAALPKSGSTLIVPAHSIGAVSLNAKVKQVTKAWGANGKCEFSCVYEGAKGADDVAATASVQFESKTNDVSTAKAWMITLSAGYKSGGENTTYDFKTPLTSFKTSKGIGIGSSAAEVQRAYPKAKRYASAGTATYSLSGGGEKATNFYLADGKHVTSVTVESHPGG
jgi:hypothetical protein